MSVSTKFVRNLFLVFGICLLGYLLFMNLIRPNERSYGSLPSYTKKCAEAIDHLLFENKTPIQEITTCENLVQQEASPSLDFSNLKSKITVSQDGKLYTIEVEGPKRNYYFPFIIEKMWKFRQQYPL
jgi:hypothetical protein